MHKTALKTVSFDHNGSSRLLPDDEIVTFSPWLCYHTGSHSRRAPALPPSAQQMQYFTEILAFAVLNRIYTVPEGRKQVLLGTCFCHSSSLEADFTVVQCHHTGRLRGRITPF